LLYFRATQSASSPLNTATYEYTTQAAASISYFNKVHLGGLAWIVNASKSTKGVKAQIDGQAWILAVRASVSSL
jgi:hypothetical protein